MVYSQTPINLDSHKFGGSLIRGSSVNNRAVLVNGTVGYSEECHTSAGLACLSLGQPGKRGYL